jgi:hypothetical protein
LFVGPDADLDRVAVFEHVWRDLDRHYSLFVVKRVDWDSLHDVYAPQAARATTDADLVEVIGAMLLELRDIHVGLSAGRRFICYCVRADGRPAFFDSALVRTEYVSDLQTAPRGLMQFGHAALDVGYVRIPSFRDSGFGADLDAALRHLGGVSALIVDVRNNSGGDYRNGVDVAARFTDRERVYGSVQYRDGPRHDDFTSRESQTVSPDGARRFVGPVAVLTNRRSVSAAERFVMAMRVLPTVVVVGDSTAGGASNLLPRELPNGWTYSLSMSIWYTPDGRSYEEIGLEPDVWVRGSAEALAAGRDAVLDTAIAIIARRNASELPWHRTVVGDVLQGGTPGSLSREDSGSRWTDQLTGNALGFAAP